MREALVPALFCLATNAGLWRLIVPCLWNLPISIFPHPFREKRLGFISGYTQTTSSLILLVTDQRVILQLQFSDRFLNLKRTKLYHLVCEVRANTIDNTQFFWCNTILRFFCMLRIILWAKLHLRFKMFLNFVRPLLYEWLHLRVIKIWIALFHINFILLFILVLMKMFRFFISNFNPIYRRFMHLYKTFFLIIGKLYCNYKPSFDLSLGLSA